MTVSQSSWKDHAVEWVIRLILYVILPVASFFALSSAFQVAVERFDKGNWQAASAVITDVDVRSAGYRTYSIIVQYSFQAGGQDFFGNTGSHGKNTVGRWGRFLFELNHSKGDRVTVHHDPADPQQNMIDRPTYWDASLRLIAGVGLGLIPLANLLYALGVGREETGEDAEDGSHDIEGATG